MKILFCDNSLRELSNFRGEVVDYYLKIGAEVILVAPKNSDKIPENANIRYIPIELSRSGMNPIKDLLYMRTLIHIYKQEKPDYIFHYTIKPNIYGTLAARWNRIPSSAIVAGLGYIFFKKNFVCRFVQFLYKFALTFAENVMVLNSASRDVLLYRKIVRPDKLIHLTGGEGVNLTHFSVSAQNRSRKNIVFLMIARLLPDKGYEEYVEAARIVKQEYPKVEFQLLGEVDVSYPQHISEERVKSDNEAGYIRYLGYCPNVVVKIQQADCIVLPSYHEGLSRVLMEALAMGKPIITTNIPGCRETVEEGKNGFLVLPKDTNSLVKAIQKFLNITDEVCMEMGKYSRIKAEREFDIADVIKIYEQITFHLFSHKSCIGRSK